MLYKTTCTGEGFDSVVVSPRIRRTSTKQACSLPCPSTAGWVAAMMTRSRRTPYKGFSNHMRCIKRPHVLLHPACERWRASGMINEHQALWGQRVKGRGPLTPIDG